MEFHGLTPENSQGAPLFISGAEGATRVNVESKLRQEDLSPSVAISKLQSALVPTSATTRPLPGKCKDTHDHRSAHALAITIET